MEMPSQGLRPGYPAEQEENVLIAVGIAMRFAEGVQRVSFEVPHTLEETVNASYEHRQDNMFSLSLN